MSKPMHLLLVGNTAWGMYNFRKGLIKTFIDKGFKISLIAPFDKVFSSKLSELGCNYIPINIDAKGTNVLCDLELTFALYKKYKYLNPDFIIHYTIKPNIFGSLAAYFAKIPHLAIITGLGYTFLKKNIITLIAQLLYKISLKSAYQVWFLNHDDQEIFISKKIVKKTKTVVINGEGINIFEFSPSKKTSKEKSFLLIARLLWDKGIGEYVEASRILKDKYPEVEFNILGYLGVKNPSAIDPLILNAWVKEGIINYLGDTENVIPFITNSTCVVLPSYREGLSRVLLEAAAMERPIVASNITGCKEIVYHGVGGFLCKVKNVNSLMKQMEKVLLLSKEELELMGKNGREKVINEFNEEEINKFYLTTISQYFNL